MKDMFQIAENPSQFQQIENFGIKRLLALIEQMVKQS